MAMEDDAEEEEDETSAAMTVSKPKSPAKVPVTSAKVKVNDRISIGDL